MTLVKFRDYLPVSGMDDTNHLKCVHMFTMTCTRQWIMFDKADNNHGGYRIKIGRARIHLVGLRVINLH